MTTTKTKKNTMIALGGNGKAVTNWDPSNMVEVKNAQEVFDSLTKDGYMAYAVTVERDTKTGQVVEGEVIKEFDKTAEKIILSPKVAGG